jgi:hypothetical protein
VLLILLPIFKKSIDHYNDLTNLSKFQYYLSLFEYLVKNNSLIHFFWSSGFISWVSSCFLWVFGLEFFSNLLFIFSIVFCLVSIFGAIKIKAKQSINFEINQVGLSIYLAIFAVSALVAISVHSFAEGILANLILLTFVFVFRILRN